MTAEHNAPPDYRVTTPTPAPTLRYHPLLHALAIATTVATFPLIFVGGLVTSHGAGLSVPDWPTSFGYNMFALPWGQWLGSQALRSGVFFEHTHRLVGSVVGVLSILLFFAALKLDQRPSVRWLAAGVLAAVIFQGILGGLRVVLVNLDLAIVHACIAQAFFCLAASMAVVTSRWWIGPAGSSTADAAAGPAYERAARTTFVLAALAVTVIYLQLIAGAVMRHHQAGLAIPDFPLSYGHLLPPSDSIGLAAANASRAADPTLNTVSLFQVWVHFAHRIGALLVTVALVPLILQALGCHAQARLRRPAWLLVGLLLAQIALGVLTVLLRKPADIASSHVAVGALLLLTAFVLALRAWRMWTLAPTSTADPGRNPTQDPALCAPLTA